MPDSILSHIVLDRLPLGERRKLTSIIFTAMERLANEDEGTDSPKPFQGEELRTRTKKAILQGATNPQNQFDAKALQNRDRSRQAYIAQMQDIATNPDYSRISISRTPADGAPMVFVRGTSIPVEQSGKSETITMSDGEGGTIKVPTVYAVVEAQDLIASHDAGGNKVEAYGGSTGIMALNNGRTAGMKQAYTKGNADAYWQALMDDEEGHGIDPVKISKLHQPVLVRVFAESSIAQLEDPGAASNEKSGAELSDPEQAMTDAKKLDESVLMQYQGSDMGNLANAGFVRAFVAAMGGSHAVGDMQTKDGKVSAAGIRRIEAAMVARAYNDESTLTDLAESPDSDLKSLGDALKQIAGRWAVMKEAVANGRISAEMDITPQLMEAVALVRKSRQQGKRISELVNQNDIFSGQTDPITESIIRLMYRGDDMGRVRSADKIRDALMGFIDRAMETAPGADLFGHKPDPLDFVSQQKGNLEAEEAAAKAQKGLFDSVAEYFDDAADMLDVEWLVSSDFMDDLGAMLDSVPSLSISERRAITGALLAGIERLRGEIPLVERRKVTTDVLANIGKLIGGNNKESNSELLRLTIPSIYTPEFHGEMLSAIRENNGMIEVTDVQAAFERLVSGKNEVVELLGKKKKDELLKLAGARYKNEKKERIIRSAYSNMVMQYGYFGHDSVSFGFGDGEMERAIKSRVDSLTQENLIKYAEEFHKARAEYKARLDEYKKALTNPETLEEFNTLIRYKGKDAISKLSPDKIALYDELSASSGIQRKQEAITEKQAEKAVIEGASSEIPHEFAETAHSKTGADLFVVKLAGDRMEKEAFYELSRKAKQLGGWYSSFRGAGAIPGFQFKTADDREKFAAILKGEQVDNSGKVEAKAEEKQDNRINRLLEMADNIESKATDKLNQNRKTNTARRARMAAGAESDARNNIAFAETLREIAKRTQSGDVKFLGNLSQQAQLGTLSGILSNAANAYSTGGATKHMRYDEREALRHELIEGRGTPEQNNAMLAGVQLPRVSVHRSNIFSLAEKLKNYRGFKQVSDKLFYLSRVIDSSKSNLELDVVLSESQIESILELAGNNGDIESSLGWYAKDQQASRKRLARMGIDTDEHLRAALRELLALKKPAQKADPLKELERSLIGAYKDSEWFNTPDAAARRVIELADLSPSHRILEPSAGLGHLADAAVSMGIPKENIDTVEIVGKLAEGLRLKGYNVVHEADFMSYAKGGYDRIIMNPPFSGDKDIQHVLHAFSLLKPGGRLAAIVSSMADVRQNKANQSFQEFLDEHGIHDEALPEGSFKASINSTGVNTKILVLEKSSHALDSANYSTKLDALEARRNPEGLPLSLSERRQITRSLLDGITALQGDLKLIERRQVTAQVLADLERLNVGSAVIESEDDLSPMERAQRDHYLGSKNIEKRNVWIPNMTPRKLNAILAKREKTPDDIEDLKDFRYFLNSDLQSAVEKGFYDQIAASQRGLVFVLKNKFWLVNIQSEIDEFESKSEKDLELFTPQDGDGLSDDPNSPSYRYKDTGYIAGSRKEDAARFIRTAAKSGQRLRATDIDFESIEENPREAAELITKGNLFGDVDFAAMRESGIEPGAAFLIGKIYAAIGTKPASDNAMSRKDFAIGLESIRDRLEGKKTAEEVVSVVKEIRDEIEGVQLDAWQADRVAKLNATHDEKWGAYKILKKQGEELSTARIAISYESQRLEYEQRKRENRKWKRDPDTDAKIAELKQQEPIAEKAWRDWKEQHPELEDKKRDLGNGYTTRSSDLEWEMRLLRNERDSIIEEAKKINLVSNQVTRSWVTFGERFWKVVHYRYSKGSDTFAGHVTNARNGRIKDWSWAEGSERTQPKKATKQEINFQMKVADTFNRKGGKPITVDSTQQLQDMIGFRAVQSGNWVLKDPVSAKFHVEHTAAAMSDLSDIVGIDVKHLGLEGRLGMAFGARGQGGKFGPAPRAHYEPVQRVINLTKMGGGGCLGHEWFHAIDNLLKELVTQESTGAGEYASESPDILPDGKIKNAMKALNDAIYKGERRLFEIIKIDEKDVKTAKHNFDRPYGQIPNAVKNAGNATDAILAIDRFYAGRTDKKSLSNRAGWRKIAAAYYASEEDIGNGYSVLYTGDMASDFVAEGQVLDGGGYGKYWSKGRELFARAFQSWTEDTLQSKERVNDYLSAFADNKYHVDPIFGIEWKPFPEGEERKRINAAFDRLFAAIRDDNVFENASKNGKLLDAIFGDYAPKQKYQRTWRMVDLETTV